MTTTTTVGAASARLSYARPVSSRRPKPGRHRSHRARTLHLLDLENLVDGYVAYESVESVWNEYRQVTGMLADEQAIVSVAKRNAKAAFFALPSGVRRVLGSDGPNGADAALIDSIDAKWVAANFGQVMLASGDHIFTPTVQQFLNFGVPVVQVIGGGFSAYELYAACTSQLYLAEARRSALGRRKLAAG